MMFRGKGRVVMAVLVVVALAIPAVGVFAGNGGAAAPAATGDLNWELVHQAPAGFKYYSIYFPSKNVGYASGGPDWNNAANGRGAPTLISKTTDGGKTWTSTTIPNTDGWARGLACKDDNNCWITGNNASVKLLRTVDGGNTWTPFSNTSGYTNWLWSAAWTKNGTSVLAGTTCYDPVDAGAKANWLRSTDGQTFSGVQAIPGTYMCYVQWDIDCPVPGVCYSTGRNYVWRTNNDGQTWAQTSPGTTRWYGLSCLSAGACWLSGKNPFIKSTTNSGGGWNGAAVSTGGQYGLTGNGHFWDIWMFPSQSGYAVGCNDMSTDNKDICLGQGIIYKTTDGVTWTATKPPVNADGKPVADLMDVWAFSETDVYVVDFSGKIWHGTGAPPPTATPTATSTPSTGVITGYAFGDVNRDDLRDESDGAVQGATLLLRRGKTEVATAVSDEQGAFRFTGVQPGQYTVEEKTAPDGFEKSRFFGTFAIEANRELIVYVGHGVVEATETPTPSPTVTITPTAPATETPTSSPTATETQEPTATVTRGIPPAYLPLITY